MPQSLHHPILGSLVYDPTLNWYTGSVTVGEAAGRLHLSLDGCEDEAQFVAAAAARIRDLPGLLEAVKDDATGALLALKNDVWLEKGEAPCTPEQFRAQMTLDAAIFYPGGKLELLFDDGTCSGGTRSWHRWTRRGMSRGSPLRVKGPRLPAR